MRGIEAYTIEAAGASGGAALRAGYLAVKSGFVDIAMVVGVEKITDKVGPDVEAVISTALDADYEAIHGLTPTAQAALLMRRYLHKYDLSHEVFSGFPLLAHANAVGNPNAMFQRAIKPALYERAGFVSDPLNLFDAAPDADGAAALIVTREDLLPPSFSKPLVRIAGSSVATDTLALHDRPDPLDFRAARLSMDRARYQAGVQLEQLDLFELFDAFSIFGALSLEAVGFANSGQGWQLEPAASDGIPISTMGGLKARGNPLGAAGVYQIVEVVTQLRGSAGPSQIQDARWGAAQSLGGPASTAVTHILERVG
jgi:acetyl-CoA C-acetyltransferase